MSDLRTRLQTVLKSLGLDLKAYEGTDWTSRASRDGMILATVKSHTAAEAEAAIQSVHLAYLAWRIVLALVRGELVRRLGEALRTYRVVLGELVSLEAGEIASEGLGEVQEMIDICDLAVGLSRQLHGLIIASECPGHQMMEMWRPMDVVGIISASSFPVVVRSWNAAPTLVCGNAIVWKSSEKTPFTAIAYQHLMQQIVDAFNAEKPGAIPAGLSQLLIGGYDMGEALVASHLVPMVSATGSTRMGRQVGVKVVERFSRSVLELGDNNAMIATPSVDLELAARAIMFATVGTADQRCTSLRRLIVHRSVVDTLLVRLEKICQSIAIGDSLADGMLVGPLIDQAAFDGMQQALAQVRVKGGEMPGGERVREDLGADAWYVRPALIKMLKPTKVMETETFAPILYVVTYDGDIEQAIAIQNGVPWGLSSVVLTASLSDVERSTSSAGSDCGIANVNIGTSGAEIGGVFGDEKEAGGGRESGSDARKGYMRCATNTVNCSGTLPLAQGVRFDTQSASDRRDVRAAAPDAPSP